MNFEQLVTFVQTPVDKLGLLNFIESRCSDLEKAEVLCVAAIDEASRCRLDDDVTEYVLDHQSVRAELAVYQEMFIRVFANTFDPDQVITHSHDFYHKTYLEVLQGFTWMNDVNTLIQKGDAVRSELREIEQTLRAIK